jgi:hypothetical protein
VRDGGATSSLASGGSEAGRPPPSPVPGTTTCRPGSGFYAPLPPLWATSCSSPSSTTSPSMPSSLRVLPPPNPGSDCVDWRQVWEALELPEPDPPSRSPRSRATVTLPRQLSFPFVRLKIGSGDPFFPCSVGHGRFASGGEWREVRRSRAPAAGAVCGGLWQRMCSRRGRPSLSPSVPAVATLPVRQA